MKRNLEQWQRVESSCVHRLRYHKQQKKLDLEYPDGEQYEYLEVSPTEFQQLTRADSVGKFVNQQIKKHRFRKIGS